MLTVRLLGQFSLTLDGKPIELPSRPAQSLLAWLILHPGIAHRREQIAGLLWPDATEENARNNLRHALWRLRRAIPDACIGSDKIAIRWLTEADWWLDVDIFTGKNIQTTSADDLLSALQLYSGELLPGFYDEWVFRERERLAALYDDRMARLLEMLLVEERWRETIEWAEKWIAQGHAPEPAYRGLMTANTALGNPAAALAAYERSIEALDQELGVPPSPETEALADAIRNSQFTIHPFDRLRTPQPQFPPPPAPPIRSNLPAPTTPLIGRERELAHLSSLLTDPAHRLVTILGPGGMGKSRLALAAGHTALPNFPDGVFLVELTALTSSAEIPRAVGDALSYPYQDDPRPLGQQILAYLRNRRLLLILDNFEHLVEDPSLLVEMLETGPDLRLLVTSRERLRFHAETVFRLDGLDYPTHTQNDGTNFPFAAAALFIQSARRANNEFAMEEKDWPSLLRICRLVGGMPLGLILAASWSGILTLGEIADELAASVAFLGQELQDMEPRHRTLEAVFAQSWQRLSPEEQTALAGLSLFAGGFDRRAAQAVAGATLPVLFRLVDRSLVWRAGDDRYDLHELIRQLALGQLAESGQEEAVRYRHSRFYLELMHRQTERLRGAEEFEAVGLMNAERENIRAAWLWAAETQRIEPMLAAQEALGIFYNRPSHWQEGIDVLGAAINALGGEGTHQALLLWLWLRGWQAILLSQTGQVPLAYARFTELLERAESADLDQRDRLVLTAFASLRRGGDLMTDRRRGKTGVDLRRALDIYRALGDRSGICQALHRLGNWETFNGQMRKGRERLEEALALVRQTGQLHQETEILHRISFVAEQMGDVDEAESIARLSLPMARDSWGRVSTANRLGFVLLASGKFEESTAISLHSIRWVEETLAHHRITVFIRNTLARGYLDLGRFVEAREEAERAISVWKESYGWEQPFIQRSLAMALLALGSKEEADDLIQSSLKSQQQMGNDNLFALSGAFVDCAYPALALNDLIEARQMLCEGLRMVQRSGAYHYGCLALPAAALLFAQEERLEGAAFVYGAIQRYPRLTTSRWYAVVALDRLAELLAPLPPDVRSVAEERGRAQGLPEMTAELLALLA